MHFRSCPVTCDRPALLFACIYARALKPIEIEQETLELLEMHGGEDAFINIKYMIPTYESCVLN